MTIQNKESYRDNSLLKRIGVDHNYTKEQVEEYIKCAEDPIYFCVNYIKIVNVDEGLINFKMWDFQKDMLKLFKENRFVITRCPRQVGKTTTSVGYLLWLTIFSESQNVAVLANKGALARDILAKYQLAYENLPQWLQQGVVTWNKGNVELENGSKIVAASTSSSAIRGGSFNCVSGESTVTLRYGERIFDEKIKNIPELIANSSKYTKTVEGEMYVFRQQVHENLFQDYEQNLGEYRSEIYDGESSYNTGMFWWEKLRRKYENFTDKSSSVGSQIINKNDHRTKKTEDVICFVENDKWSPRETFESETRGTDTSNKESIGGSKKLSIGQKTFRRNETKNANEEPRPYLFKRDETKDIRFQTRTRFGNTKVSKYERWCIESLDGKEKNQRTFRQDKQESRKNTKDCGKTSRDEAFRRIQKENEFGSQRKNSLEQRFEVLTDKGFKTFAGLKITHKQQTVKLQAKNTNIECTADHLIFTIDGWKKAHDCDNKLVLINGHFEKVTLILNNVVQDVYDLLEVENTHSFYANGILVHNCVFLDEFAFVPNNIANEFFNSVYPVISSGKSTKIIIVSTPNGMNLFYKLWMDSIEGRNNYKNFEIHWSMVPGRDEDWKEETIRNTSQRQFDQEFGCEFLGSSNTLISGYKLQQLRYINPIAEHDKMKIYEHPIKEGQNDEKTDHLYAMTVDVSEGKNLDSSTFSIFDISTTPYKQVATYSSSSISPILFPTIIVNAARVYNDAYILIEINNNPQVADFIHSDLEYENLLKVFTGNKKPQQLSAGFARGIQMGLKMSPQVKSVGCSNLKTLIEGDKLIINDFDTYSELTTFEQYKTSFAAAEGANDDMAMTLVIFAWATTQQYFREIVNHDLRKQIQLENMNQIDEDVLPAPIIEDGLQHDFMVEGGDIWEVADGGDTYGAYTRDFFKRL